MEDIPFWIWQCAAVLGYNEPQIIDFLKAPYPKSIFDNPIMDLGQAIDEIKRVLTKKKLDPQITRQVAATSFLTVKDKLITIDPIPS